MSFMEQEILEQPQSLARLINEERSTIAQVASALRAKAPDVVLIVARGTSDNAATYAKYLFGYVNHTVTALAAASLVTLYNGSLKLTNAAVIGISQSGQSTDVVEVVRHAAAAGALTIAITNDPTSPLASAGHFCINLRAGEEKALPATKTYTAQLTALALLSALWADRQDLADEIAALPQAVAATLGVAPIVEQAARRFHNAVRCVCLARGFNYATALEAALKLKETCYVGAEPYSTADFMHGPIAMIERGFPAILFAPPGRAQSAMMEMAQALAQREAATIIIGRGTVLAPAVVPVAMPADVTEILSPILYIIPGQLFALSLATAKGLDPDAPRGLRKVTLTR